MRTATTTTTTLLTALALAAGALGCHATGHPLVPAALGTPRATHDLEAVLDRPGPIVVETVIGADWQVPRSGLINLDHPNAEAAGLEDGPEPIQIAFHALRHPTRGLWLVDTGVEKAFRDAPDDALIRGLVADVMGLETLKVRTDTATWLAAQAAPPQGVFLTHLHADHVAGLRDVPRDVPVFVGPGENDERSLENLFASGIYDRALEGRAPLRELAFAADPDRRFAGVLDVFGDGTLWALHVPGHTPGSTAFVVRTPEGPVLLTGDACHTAWGWDHGVEPGSFSHDAPQSAVSLASLRRLAAEHPALEVRLGHQPRPAGPAAVATTTRRGDSTGAAEPAPRRSGL